MVMDDTNIKLAHHYNIRITDIYSSPQTNNIIMRVPKSTLSRKDKKKWYQEYNKTNLLSFFISHFSYFSQQYSVGGNLSCF